MNRIIDVAVITFVVSVIIIMLCIIGYMVDVDIVLVFMSRSGCVTLLLADILVCAVSFLILIFAEDI